MELLPQSQPNRACARAGWKIRLRRWSMKGGGTARCFQAIASHYFQCMLAQCRAVGREQDVAVSLRQSESVNEQVFEIMFHLKRFSSGQTRESRRIKNNQVKFLAFPYQPRQHRPGIILDEAMLDCGKAVQCKILASARQILFGKIDVEGSCSDVCRTDRKRAGKGKAVQQSPGREVAHIPAIFSLIEKESWGIAGPKIDSES
jgi:hypothetical protein